MRTACLTDRAPSFECTSGHLACDNNKRDRCLRLDQPLLLMTFRKNFTTCWVVGGPYLPAHSFDLKVLERKAEQLSAANAIEGSSAKVAIAQLKGDWEECQRWIRNLRLLHARGDADRNELIAASNLGFFTRAQEVFGAVIDDGGYDYLPAGVICGSFKAMNEGYRKATKAGMTLPDDSGRVEALARNADSVMQRIGATEAQLARMLDIAGEVTRENRLLWESDAPLLYAIDTPDHAALLVEFELGVSIKVAVELTDQVIDRAIRRGHDVPGVAFSFIGRAGGDREWP